MASLKPESSCWLQALPSRSLGTLLENNCFRISVALRLGLNICKPHTCVCGGQVNENGIHGLSCKKSAGRHPRHQEINNIICRALQTAKIPSALEPVGMCRSDGKRVDGATLVPWNKGKTLIWDATCVDTLASSYLDITSVSSGAAACKAALSKRSKYKELIDQNFIFVPFSVETFGPWCPEGIGFIDNLGDKISLILFEPKSKYYLKIE